ncbi:CDP-alcohol phosphatidyltransferase family protein [Pontiella sulfatireligans]|uniref:CDP-diacylglycerol--serine O-phosphatidyltransferase n=1 Tax=Pontiella sulfatireligans TaxID=2750658 RepID=A0A6C2UTX5_9BACT|nr:CDP-alcohol phosphatidyltransferase family protein [Pontiella sulfatireligans]VGO22751.1 hypothetical protein SCARR_04847 [Pontiella sulfatireligans]
MNFTESKEHRFNPVPSLLTLCNALCGFASIIYTMEACFAGRPVPTISLLLIGGSMLFDVLDGLAARVLKAQSTHGMHLDSLADAISFGAAPAIMIYAAGPGHSSEIAPLHLLSWIAASFYLGCALWRLAAFNTAAEDEAEHNSGFIGLPSPGAAAAICSMTLVVPHLTNSETVEAILYLAYAFTAAFLMVSAVPYMHIRNTLTVTTKPATVAVILLFIASIIFFNIWALVAWAHIYVLSSPLHELEARFVRKVRTAGVTLDDEP